ncbi:MAG: methyltransferase domain-containing protein [Planctomycetales bacterium]|nr:methyltransferase domain-containing protein [Planctomycetales bacterium]
MHPSELANYKSAEGAARYNVRYETHFSKRLSDRIEKRLLEGLLARIGRQELLLDVPAGTGRLSGLLRAGAARLLEADVSREMLKVNRANRPEGALGHLVASALSLPLRERSVPCVVSVRLSHHLEDEERRWHLVELMRVARDWVVVTYFAHGSVKNWLRRVRSALTGRPPKKTLPTAEVRAIAGKNGFRVEADRPLARLFSGQRYALLRRAAAGGNGR